MLQVCDSLNTCDRKCLQLYRVRTDYSLQAPTTATFATHCLTITYILSSKQRRRHLSPCRSGTLPSAPTGVTTSQRRPKLHLTSRACPSYKSLCLEYPLSSSITSNVLNGWVCHHRVFQRPPWLSVVHRWSTLGFIRSQLQRPAPCGNQAHRRVASAPTGVVTGAPSANATFDKIKSLYLSVFG